MNSRIMDIKHLSYFFFAYIFLVFFNYSFITFRFHLLFLLLDYFSKFHYIKGKDTSAFKQSEELPSSSEFNLSLSVRFFLLSLFVVCVSIFLFVIRIPRPLGRGYSFYFSPHHFEISY